MKYNVLHKHDYQIELDFKAWQEFKYIMSKYKLEFTSFMYGDKKDDNVFYIHTPFYPEQENSSVKTDVDSEALVKLMLEEGMDIGRITGHQHSHNTMNVFPSSTDTSEIKERGKHNFSASIITNNAGEIYGHIVDNINNVHVEDVKVIIKYPKGIEQDGRDYIKTMVASAKNLSDIRKYMSLTDDDIVDRLYTLSTERKSYLDRIIKERFRTMSYGFKNKHTTKGSKTKGYKNTYNKFDDDKWDWDSMVDYYSSQTNVETDEDDMREIYSFEEIDTMSLMDRVEYLEFLEGLDFLQMTDKEYLDYCELIKYKDDKY